MQQQAQIPPRKKQRTLAQLNSTTISVWLKLVSLVPSLALILPLLRRSFPALKATFSALRSCTIRDSQLLQLAKISRQERATQANTSSPYTLDYYPNLL